MPSWFPPSRPLWLRPAREQRLAQHRALVENVPPISCGTPALQQQRRAMEQDMATWTVERWEAYDAPWAKLLAQWLDGPEDPEGLHDLRVHHEQAWWPARFSPSRPDQTSVTRLVWDRLRQGQAMPGHALCMASMSSRTFHQDLWTWTLADGRPELIRQTAYALAHRAAPAILNAMPTAAPGALDTLWAMRGPDARADFLVCWVADDQGRADTWLKGLASRPRHRYTDGGGRPLPDEWHAAFFRALDQDFAQMGAFPAQRWATFWPGSDYEVLRRELAANFKRWTTDTLSEAAWLKRVDALTAALEPIVPTPWWGDSNFWPHEHLQRMPLTQARLLAMARHTTASQSPPPAPRRPRARS